MAKNVARTCLLAMIVGVAGFYFGCKPRVDTAVVKGIADTPEYSSQVKLKISADENTGEITARFPLDGSGILPGQDITVVWDIVPAHKEEKCSKLKYTHSGKVANGGDSGIVKWNISDSNVPKSALATLAASAHGGEFSKAEPKMVNGKRAEQFFGHTMVDGCVKVGTKFVGRDRGIPEDQQKGFGLDEDDSNLPVNIRYAERCAQEIGYIPVINCLEMGKEVPIFLNGERQTKNTTKCDKPVYLPTGQTYCNTYTRVGRLPLFKDKELTTPRTDSQAVFFCRHYNDTYNKTINGDASTAGPNYPRFDDVAIIMQNEDSGKTCYFQALGSNSLLGTRAPPPTETNDEWNAKITPEQKAAGAQPASAFWLPPASIANIHCVGCHDNDPFMHSPWIDQVKTDDGELIVPSIPFSDYKIIGEGFGFEEWDTNYEITVDNDECASCHRITSMATCRNWLNDAFPVHAEGQDPPASDFYERSFKSEWALAHPNHHWMPPPPDNPARMERWSSRLANYDDSIADYRKCCKMIGDKVQQLDDAQRRELGEQKYAQLRRARKTWRSYGIINSPGKRKFPAEALSEFKENGCELSPLTEVITR